MMYIIQHISQHIKEKIDTGWFAVKGKKLCVQHTVFLKFMINKAKQVPAPYYQYNFNPISKNLKTDYAHINNSILYLF